MNKYLRLGVSAALMGYIAWNTNWPKVGESFAHLRVELWLSALALLAFTQILSAIRWQIVSQALRFDRSWKEMTGFYFIGLFFNLVLPTSVGGDLVRAVYLNGRTGRKLPAFAAVFLDRLSGLLVLLAMACTAVTLSPELPDWIPWTVWGTTGAILGGLVSLPLLARFIPQVARRMHQIQAGWAAIRAPWVLMATTLLSTGVQVGNVAMVWLIGLALDAPVPASFYWVLVPMVSLLTLLPISVNGMGVREGGTRLLLAPLGVSKDLALSLAFLWFFVHVAVSLAGGLVYLFGRFARPETNDLTKEGPTDHEPVHPHSDQGRAGQFKAAA